MVVVVVVVVADLLVSESFESSFVVRTFLLVVGVDDDVGVVVSSDVLRLFVADVVVVDDVVTAGVDVDEGSPPNANKCLNMTKP